MFHWRTIRVRQISHATQPKGPNPDKLPEALVTRPFAWLNLACPATVPAEGFRNGRRQTHEGTVV